MKYCINPIYGFLYREFHGSWAWVYLLILFVFISGSLKASPNPGTDSLKVQLSKMTEKLNTLEEKVDVQQNDLGKLKKMKLSGYIQAQFESDQPGLVSGHNANNTFYIRRAYIKFNYEPVKGIQFVLEPDFSTGNIAVKDAYAVASYPTLPWLTLWAGQFDRLDYEVEYSSGNREVLERSRLIRTIYPGEQDVGAKLEINPAKVPVKLQLALFNGNFTGTQQKDADSRKDLMVRGVYTFRFPSPGLHLNLGASVYYGGIMTQSNYLLNYKNQLDSLPENYGKYMDKLWFGTEAQFYFNLLGGLAVKAEYIAGKDAFPGDSKLNPNKMKKFAGYYLYLIKNIGKRNQFVWRYDYFDPNTELSGNSAGNDLSYSTVTLAWQYYLNETIRFSINYEMPKNETNYLVPHDIKDNVLGIRMQAKF